MKNEYQEALGYFLNRDEGDNLTVTCDWLSNAEELKELVDKEIPMKPVYRIPDISWNKNEKLAHCPTCDWRLDWEQGCHNNKCRQRIDWSGEE